jgi:uncharacterized protein YdeI (YjbR/CyaY-like superfamily)
MEELKTILKMPIELVNALASSDKARYFFDTLAASHRRAYMEWVGSATQDGTRKERAKKTIMMLETCKKRLTTQPD